jgi:ABC-type multidrug transport system ATPase subunit/alpha-tubulin suppressor-like RCC1 family protein/CRP-like cAMP-binding protein
VIPDDVPAQEDRVDRRWVILLLAPFVAIASSLIAGALAQDQGALSGVAAIGTGGGHGLAVKGDGAVWAWGYNAHGQIGTGQVGEPVLTPVEVPGLSGVIAVAGGEFHSLALAADGTVWAWGENDKGQLGDGTTTDSPVPIQVPGLSNVAAIDADGDHSYALRRDGTIVAWGDNSSGVFGNGTTDDSLVPVPVSGLGAVVALAAGWRHTVALTDQGTVFGWGDNSFGQVGVGAATDDPILTPVPVGGLPGAVVAIAAAQLGDYSLALLADGTVVAWGRNDQGMLGIGRTTTEGCQCESVPSPVSGLRDVTTIAASGGAGAALTGDGLVWAWGNNEFGQVGTGDVGGAGDYHPSPSRVQGLGGVRDIEGGGGFFLASLADGTVAAWGINGFGELGNGTSEHSGSPAPVGLVPAGEDDGFLEPLSSASLLWLVVGAAVGVTAMFVAPRLPRPARAEIGQPSAVTVPRSVASDVSSPAPPSPLVPPEAPTPGDQDGAVREYERRIRFLGRVDLLQDAAADVIAQVAHALKPLSVPSGAIVCREGEPGNEFFLVESGTLAVTLETGTAPHDLALLGPGDFFGEIALLGGRLRTATVRAETDAHLWTLATDEFHALLARQPEIDEFVRRRAAERAATNRMGAFEVEHRNLAALADHRRTIRIGRITDNDLVFPSQLVSQHHAIVEQTGDLVRLLDLNSEHGTYVNGEKVRTADLRDGDEIWVAGERFVFDRRALHSPVEPWGIRIDATELGKEVKGGKHLLHDVTLSILPGEFVAIVGGSGTGKSTLLDAMSGARPGTSGQVLYNGRAYYRNIAYFRNVLGYVPQDDIIHTGLPLRVTLEHAARLRLPPDTSTPELATAVDTVLAELELTEQADVKVAALSGGQRKRASIGVELLTRPRVIFLDEPTSGLDPLTDAQTMGLLRRLADSGSTVVLTTHATKNVMLCDKVIFLARGGYQAFVGTPRGALRYFDAEEFDGIYRRLAEEGTPEDWARRFRDSPDHTQAVRDQLRPVDAAAETAARPSLATSGQPGGFRRRLREFGVLSRRNLDLYRYNPANLPLVIMPPILFTLLALALFRSGAFDLDAGNSAAPLQILFLIAFSAFIFGLLFGVQEIVKEFPVFRRERMVNLGIIPYVLSKASVLAPLLTVLLIVMVAILKLTGRLPGGGVGLYAQLLLTLMLTGFVGLSLAFFTSALVATPQQATDMLSLWIMPQVLFGGALLAIPAMNAVGRIISVIAPVRWSFEALGQVAGLRDIFVNDTSRIGPGLAIQYGDSFSRNPAQNWIILGVFIVVPLVLTCVVLARKTSGR